MDEYFLNNFYKNKKLIISEIRVVILNQGVATI